MQVLNFNYCILKIIRSILQQDIIDLQFPLKILEQGQGCLCAGCLHTYPRQSADL